MVSVLWRFDCISRAISGSSGFYIPLLNQVYMHDEHKSYKVVWNAMADAGFLKGGSRKVASANFSHAPSTACN